MSFKKILCPVDFSDGSRVALLAAAALAKDSHGSLTIAHFLQMPAVGFSLPRTPIFVELRDKLADEVERLLADWRHTALGAGAPVVDISNGVGPAWREIVKLAHDGAYDLVVVGSHGLTGLERVFIGSVSEKVTRHAPCPVLVVRPKEPPSAPSPEPRS